MRRYLLPLLFLINCATLQAASLYGKVIEVNSGDVITIFNLNRPVRVKLLGVDAPEMNQEFGEVAKKHLSDLVFNQAVLVNYSGIGPDKSLTGKVLLNDADIGAQMIRDGAAWLDANNSDRLSATDREVYQQSELAARSERRGLWQAQNPVAPWEFVKAQSVYRNPTAHLDSNPSTSRRASSGSTTELNSMALIPTPAGAAGSRRMSRSEVDAAWATLNGSNKKFHEMRPAGQNFSVLVPEQGQQLTQPIAFRDEMADLNMYIARDAASIYVVVWLTGPSYGESDKVAIDDVVLNVIKTTHKEYKEADRGHFFCRQQSEKDISTNGYVGREFDMSSCSLPTRARAFTKVVENQRQMYVGMVFYGDEDENVGRFIKSFMVGRPRPKTR